MSHTDIIQALLAITGLASLLIGGYVGIVKLRPEQNSAAVAQALDVAKGMKLLKDDLEKERDQWRARALAAELAIAQGAAHETA